jgi:AraC-like DNA-binding protein
MLFRSYKPSAPLSDFVENLSLYNGFDSPRLKERIFPSGTFEIVFNLRADEIRIYKDAQSDEFRRYSGAVVSGPYAEPLVTDTALEESVIGVHFKPGGAFPFLTFHADELCNSHVDLQLIWGQAGVQTRERLCETESPARRFRILEKVLLSRLSRRLEHHSAVALALATLAHTRSQMTRELARDVGLSEKRFIDIFRFEVGLNPKLFTRLCRFQRLLAQVHQSCKQDWAQLALDHGYFDQSHLIRDFLAFSSFSPANYVRQLHGLRCHGLHAKFGHLPLAH